ncbi:hypothetical protein AAT19DRAFT_10188 [Rhodotorula toruloides]|uniref:Uncharacterized protein n=1 Tax=Rhodotorula toruloides TaxID=5286 RepID=A0A2S9ZZZ7_RHOTO|nr:hypothetical protein AAT19DRAFT_10188 [Rhodotorula toruloides]
MAQRSRRRAAVAFRKRFGACGIALQRRARAFVKAAKAPWDVERGSEASAGWQSRSRFVSLQRRVLARARELSIESIAEHHLPVAKKPATSSSALSRGWSGVDLPVRRVEVGEARPLLSQAGASHLGTLGITVSSVTRAREKDLRGECVVSVGGRRRGGRGRGEHGRQTLRRWQQSKQVPPRVRGRQPTSPFSTLDDTRCDSTGEQGHCSHSC